ncbi:30S ribosomal protein S7 [Pseudobdellovibrio exovorus]|uniref:Small ribosomal subunit protein uS7 n=1 Tax=Pseudobdellovibrio exovorus JSS TaxID=1184267 RepID=M4VCC2_9BACT|nr:30S ribosomal protein S7 [Pseudobdellovibrio exovorus]AGH96130.1 30S ribosomal protein S7 [Pseudobdellovibrio exovorus JSS]
MSRRNRKFKREIIPDPVYKDIVVAKFINKIMERGQKSTAQKLFYGALEELKGKVPGEESIAVMKKALENVKPSIEVRSRRVGGATYQVPVDVRPTRRLTLAMRWLVEYSRARGEKDFTKKLAGELLDAYNNRGNSIKKKEDVHKMAESNKAFAHYNW